VIIAAIKKNNGALTRY